MVSVNPVPVLCRFPFVVNTLSLFATEFEFVILTLLPIVVSVIAASSDVIDELGDANRKSINAQAVYVMVVQDIFSYVGVSSYPLTVV